MYIHCISIYLFCPSHDTDDMARMQAAALSGGNPAAAAAAMAAASAAVWADYPDQLRVRTPQCYSITDL